MCVFVFGRTEIRRTKINKSASKKWVLDFLGFWMVVVVACYKIVFFSVESVKRRREKKRDKKSELILICFAGR